MRRLLTSWLGTARTPQTRLVPRRTRLGLTALEDRSVPAVLVAQTPTDVGGGGPIRVSTSNYYAGAISSITWGGKEFVDSYDHGRLVQSAVNATPTNPALLAPGINPGEFDFSNYNPTEGGSYYDAYTSTTAPNGYAPNRPSSSVLLSASNPTGSTFTSRTQMAFFGYPGRPGGANVRNPGADHKLTPDDIDLSANGSTVSNYITERTVTVGVPGLPGNVIAIDTAVTVPQGDQNNWLRIDPVVAFFNVQLLTSLDRLNSQLGLPQSIGNPSLYTPVPSGTTDNATNDRDVPNAVFASSADGSYSFGVFTQRVNTGVPVGTYYTWMDHGGTTAGGIGALGEKSYIMPRSDIPSDAGHPQFVYGTFRYRSYLAVGSRADVVASLAAVTATAKTPKDVTANVTSVTPSSVPVASENGGNAKDNNLTTKWLATMSGPANTATLTYTFPGGKAVGSYSLSAANDAQARDPKSWMVHGSLDGSNWVQLDVQTNQQFGGGRFSTNAYRLRNATAYTHYRLTVTANNGSPETGFGGTGLVQLSEFRLTSSPRTTASDFDGDGVSDILWNHPDGGNHLWYQGVARPGGPISPAGAGDIPTAGDFNGDGVSDILWHSPTTGANSIWLFANPGSYGVGTPNSGNPWLLGTLGLGGSEWAAKPVVGDFNGDGVSDILWHSPGNGANSIWYLRDVAGLPGGSSPILYALPFSSTEAAAKVTAGDFDGDGVSDILWHSPANGSNVVWYFQNPRPADTYINPVRSGQAFGSSSSTSMPVVADFDGDGRADILWNETNGASAVWYTNGPAFWITSVSPGAIPTAGDFNGDGVADIMWHDPTNGTNAIWLFKKPVQQTNGQWDWVLQGYWTGASAPTARAVR